MKINGADLNFEFHVEYEVPNGARLNLEFSTAYLSDIRSVGITDSSALGKPSIKLATHFIQVSPFSGKGVFGKTSVNTDTPKIKPVGIAWDDPVSTPEYVRWRRFIEPTSIAEPPTPTMVSRIRALGGYQGPFGGNLNLNWGNEKYYPPITENLNIDFGQIGYKSLIITLGDQAAFGTADISKSLALAPQGIFSTEFGVNDVSGSINIVRNLGWNNSTFGASSVENLAAPLKPASIIATAFGSARIELWRRYVQVSAIQAIPLSDKLIVGGGVRFVQPYGYAQNVFGTNKIEREWEVQTAKPSSIAPIALPQPNVSPQIIFQRSFIATLWGQNLIQHNPSPKGFVNTTYGNAWLTLGQRFLSVPSFNTFAEGYPKVFDPKQYIIQQLTHIPGAIFGDIAIRNKSLIIKPTGSDQSIFSDWTWIESNLRYVVAKSDNIFTLFGNNNIRNKTPSLAPKGMQGVIGQHSVAFYLRNLIPPGKDHLAVGKPILTKTPEIAPKSLIGTSFGLNVIGNYRRSIDIPSFDSSKLGNPISWHRVRYINGISGIDSNKIGTPNLTTSVRELLIKGPTFDMYGTPLLTFRIRKINPKSITETFYSNHSIGGTQYLKPYSFIATQFGSRITPETRNVYVSGFMGIFGDTKIKNRKHYIHALGFNSDNTWAHGRWGSAKTFNLRQYITMFYDVNSDLTPPSGNSKWTSISNRNKTIGALGENLARYGRPLILNNAMAILPVGIDSTVIKDARISFYRRILKLDGIEAPYISAWLNVSNGAKVLNSKGLNTEVFGRAAVENTRRTFKFQGYGNQIFGYPMVAYRIRTVDIETRYGIAPPRIELPNVQLLKRYVEPSAIDSMRLGATELFRYQGRITTRWAHNEFFGEPIVRNVTPELKVRSFFGEEIGNLQIEHLTRYIDVPGFVGTNIPKHKIEFLTRSLQLPSIPPLVMPTKHTVVRIGSEPYSKQFIDLRKPEILEWEKEEDSVGYGIQIPGAEGLGADRERDSQVPSPIFNQSVIYHQSDKYGLMTLFGEASIYSNSINVSPGLYDLFFGEAAVTLRKRYIQVSKFPDDQIFEPSKPRVSPWTIYATVEAPYQAVINHPVYRTLHVVNSMAVFGNPVITLRHRKVTVLDQMSQNLQTRFGTQYIGLYRRYINPPGINSLRSGLHLIPGKIHKVTQVDSEIHSRYGQPSIEHIFKGPRTLLPRSITAAAPSVPKVEFFHRTLILNGFNSLQMGSSRYGDTPYYPQSLWIGAPRPIEVRGNNTSLFGKVDISYRVRHIQVEGFYSFISEYNFESFKDRLKVIRLSTQPIFKNQVVGVDGIGPETYSVPDIRLKAHYIRPDGNSDQYRKGIPK